MKIKVFIGSTMAVALLGLGVLAGSVAGSGSASAQTSSTTPTVPSSAPSTGLPNGMGIRGHGPGGFDGDFGGRRGQIATADNATQQITNATNLINLVNSDLTYANGKMDTADVQRWVNGADSLLTSAQNANSSSQYGQAVAYAGAARELAMTADQQMAQKLGADKLPSYSQMPKRANKDTMATTTTLTQAQASRILADTYDRLQITAAQVKGASNAAEATPYLTDAQNAYKTAYTAYQAGNYNDAAASARLAGKLAGVANTVVRASTAPANSDTPVNVPAPNF